MPLFGKLYCAMVEVRAFRPFLCKGAYFLRRLHLLSFVLWFVSCLACQTRGSQSSSTQSLTQNVPPFHCDHPSQFGDMSSELAPTDADTGTGTLLNGNNFQDVTATYTCTRNPPSRPALPTPYAFDWRCDTAAAGGQNIFILRKFGARVMAWMRADGSADLAKPVLCGS